MIVNLSADAAIAVTPVSSGVKPDVGLKNVGYFVGLLVAVSGSVVFTDAAGNVVTLTGPIAAGVSIPVKCLNVLTSSTATIYGIVGVS